MQLCPKRCRNIRVLATDMDGTFFSAGLTVREDAVKAYRRAVKEGLLVVPATGRSLEGVASALTVNGVANEVQLAPGVYMNGCLTLGSGGVKDVLLAATINPDTAKRILTVVRTINEERMSVPGWDQDPLVKDAPVSHGFLAVANRSLKPAYMCLAAYSNGEIVFEEENQLTDGLRQFREGVNRPVGPLLEYAKHNTLNKLLVLSHSGGIIERHLAAIQGDDATVTLTAAIPRILEIVPAHINKSNALRIIAENLGLSMDNIAAIGDGNNDYEMLRDAGVSIAMGNAPPSILEVAQASTGHVDEGGWGAAVNCLLDMRQEGNREQ